MKKGEQFILPEWMHPYQYAWDEFVKMRIVIKKPMTEYAKHLAILKLERFKKDGHNIVEIMNNSIFNNWQDLYEPKTNGKFVQDDLGKRMEDLKKRQNE